MSSPDLLYTVHIAVAPKLILSIEISLELLGQNASRWHDKLNGETRFDIFFESRTEADNLAEKLDHQLTQHADKENWEISIEEIPNKKWQDSWKEFFHVERVSEHIVIKPSHEDFSPEPGDCVIKIDPGMSFGTGQHETTKACLQFLDKLSSSYKNESTPCSVGSMSQSSELQRARKQEGNPTNKTISNIDNADRNSTGYAPRSWPRTANTTDTSLSFLDLGCGSGILSIAAAQLGFTPIRALDIDPDSVRIAGENFTVNNVQDGIKISIGDVSKLELSQTYDVVAANILAPILLANKEQIASTVTQPNGNLILAGILNEQYEEIAKAYTSLGFKETDKTTEKEWTSGCFIRQ